MCRFCSDESCFAGNCVFSGYEDNLCANSLFLAKGKSNYTLEYLYIYLYDGEASVIGLRKHDLRTIQLLTKAARLYILKEYNQGPKIGGTYIYSTCNRNTTGQSSFVLRVNTNQQKRIV